MAFNFGNTAKISTFGSTPAQSSSTSFAGFGTSFGTPAASAAPTFGTSFGTPAAAATPTFGTSFGAPAASAAPAFGSSFGAPAASAASGFGSSFGSPAASAASGFGSSFGTPAASAAPGFGSSFGAPAASAAASGFGSSFGTPAASAASGFGSSFGAPAASTAPAFGTGFGAPAASTAPAFGSSFGAPAASAAPAFGTGGGLFGSTATTQTTGLFGTSSATPSPFGAASAPTTNLFGGGMFGGAGAAASTTTPFGGGFGAKPAAAGFGGFGTNNANTTAFSGFGGTQQGGAFGGGNVQPAAPPQISKSQQTIASVYAINVFNDERDDILKKWNMLQACWGTGKGYHNASQPAVDYDTQNPFYRFKAMGYNLIPDQDTSDGIVNLVFSKKIEDLTNQQEVLRNGIAGILGNKPNLSVEINAVKSMSDNQTEVQITVSEKGVTGSSRKIPASDLSFFLNQPMQKQQLVNVGVIAIGPCVTPSKTELEEYLKTPPAGVDPQMWQAAIQDNPNPKKYIPVPINGFSDLRSRMLHQERQTGLHQSFLEKVNKEISQLKTRHSSSTAQITELKSKFLELEHRILRVLVKQESTRKVGIALQPEEELLRGRFEIMHQQLNNPKQFKGQLNELLSNVKMMEGVPKPNNGVNYRLDGDAQDDIKDFLRMEQNGISQLINIVQTDLEALNTINEGMRKMMQNGNVLQHAFL